MLNILRTSWQTGRVTEDYPERPEQSASRGRPEIDPARCDRAANCARICPSGAITVSQTTSSEWRWQLDLARCVFCGLCEEVCPNGAIALTHDFELATRGRNDLIVGVSHRPPAVARVGELEVTAGLNSPAASGHAPHGRIRNLLRRSLHIRHMAAGSENSCDWEIAALLNPVYDVQRLGIDFVASPRHADLLLVTGAVTRNLEPALSATYDAMPFPRLVVAVGDEACSGGLLQGSYAVAGGVDRCLPVDVYIPGDPPRPQALIQGLLVAVGRREPEIRRTELVAGLASGTRVG